MDNNKQQRKNPVISKRYWIIGAGRFGRIAVSRIKERQPGAIITVVDKKHIRFDDPTVTVVCQDGIAWLSAMLHEKALVDWIVPAIPIHVAKQWLVRKLPKHFHMEPIPVPDGWLTKMPHPLRGTTGQVYVSHADFICPDDCPEPKNRCTHTGKPRPMDLFRLLKRLDVDSVLPIVFRSHQLRPGVGGILPGDLFNAFQTVMENCHRPLMIATACRCHGVVDFIRIEKSSSRQVSFSQPVS